MDRGPHSSETESTGNQPEITIFGSSCKYNYGNSDFIGRGTFGIVYQASIIYRGDFAGPEIVAIKVVHLDKDTVDSEDYLVKMHRRFDTLVALNHSNIVLYHKVTLTRAPGGACIELMMDYCTGGDLATFLNKMRQSKILLGKANTIQYGLEMADGLAFLHDRRIIHGDLKPENILLMSLPNSVHRVLIGDLDDLVQIQRTSTWSADIQRLRGTPRYMSPEMLRKFAGLPAEIPGRKTDIWSLGCILLDLVEVVTGN
ncbi:uncharacterized protein LOC129592313 [Paramacrobiotus metropolitanus]|uniref:uncharacterized protein LOC129592313 n=1 Tax=Paramacrobiotus metropolitanus TaxID=2943436 RepID=UPI0024461E83|nr:uncharacterized protein LOC129592313 [Paramacrobiotus metropolitanus]